MQHFKKALICLASPLENGNSKNIPRDFPSGAVVKNLPANTGHTGLVQSPVWEDPTCRGATKPVRHNY